MKIKHFIGIIGMTLIVCLGLSFTSCSSSSDDAEPTISVNGTASIESDGTVIGDITVTAEHTDWTVGVSYGKEWLTAYKNGNKVTFSAKENTSTDSRNATVVVTATASSNLSHTVNIVQKGASSSINVNGTENTDITFTGAFDNKSGIDFKQIVKVVSNVNWSVSGKPDWLSISPSNGNGNVDMTIYPVSENETSSPRTATITLIGAGKTATINITQEAGKPVCYVEIQNEVVLHDRMCWEYKATSNANIFQWILLSEREYNRLTDKELLEEVSQAEKLKFTDEYLSFIAYDSHNNEIASNSTYYVVTLASDTNGKTGELIKKKIVTPSYKNGTQDAWVSFSNVYSSNSKGFWFDTTKKGYCNTYHLIYGIIPSDYTFNSAVYAFEINYYLKYKKKHWYADSWAMEIETDYPNNNTFTYSTNYLSVLPRCFAYGWGVFKDGTLSSDLLGFQWDTSVENSMKRIKSSSEKKKNVLIKRSVEQQRAKKMHR